MPAVNDGDTVTTKAEGRERPVAKSRGEPT